MVSLITFLFTSFSFLLTRMICVHNNITSHIKEFFLLFFVATTLAILFKIPVKLDVVNFIGYLIFFSIINKIHPLDAQK